MHVNISSILFVPQVNTSKYLSMIKAQHINHDIKRTTCRPVKKDQYLPSHRTSFGDLTMMKLTLSSRSIHKLKLDFYYTL